MAGTRKIAVPTEPAARHTIILPVEIDERLRRYAAERGSQVAPIVREWIIEKLRECCEGG